MGRINKTTEGVFVNIVGTIDKHPMYEQFLNQKILGSESQSSLAKFLETYKSQCIKMKMDFQRLADLEVIIMQLNIRMSYKGTVKIYTMTKKSGITYIYARCPFYRLDSTINELRVLIDNMDKYSNRNTDEALSMLSGNVEFMSQVYYRLEELMDSEIEQNIKNYFQVYQNKFGDIKQTV